MKGVKTMRLWHRELLPYLPDLQFKGQLRELVAIMHDWRDKKKTNHLLINKVMEYPKKHLTSYYLTYSREYFKRYGKRNVKLFHEFIDFSIYFFEKECEIHFENGFEKTVVGEMENIFPDWHNKEYLRVCMANLYEKHFFGIGKSRITDEEWARLCEGYEQITGEKYQI